MERKGYGVRKTTFEKERRAKRMDSIGEERRGREE